MEIIRERDRDSYRHVHQCDVSQWEMSSDTPGRPGHTSCTTTSSLDEQGSSPPTQQPHTAAARPSCTAETVPAPRADPRGTDRQAGLTAPPPTSTLMTRGR